MSKRKRRVLPVELDDDLAKKWDNFLEIVAAAMPNGAQVNRSAVLRAVMDAGIKTVLQQRGHAASTDKPLTLRYRNWRGEVADRTIAPKRIWYGSTEHHPEPQWLLDAWDVERNADRTFALSGFIEVLHDQRDAAHEQLAVAREQTERLRQHLQLLLARCEFVTLCEVVEGKPLPADSALLRAIDQLRDEMRSIRTARR